jgi:translation initiation factor IF-1
VVEDDGKAPVAKVVNEDVSLLVYLTHTDKSASAQIPLGMKMDRIWMDITDIVFVFIFMSGFGFEYG